MTASPTNSRRLTAALAICAIVALARPHTGNAWEADTTHAGLTEQSALGSSLHQRLRDQFGIERGLFASLIIPPADAPELFKALRTLNPTHGHVPDSRGRLNALGWLAAGSVVADIPPKHAANHFFDPAKNRGLTDATLKKVPDRARHQLGTRFTRDKIIRSGMSAVDWVFHQQNPMNLTGFVDQYSKGISAATPGERQRHIAGALVAAGNLLHVLQDMGSPSHVRDDLAAHLQVVGNDTIDVGSRFERIAALAYGRLSIPAARDSVRARTLRAFFTTNKREGLADRTSRRWFSRYTVPGTVTLRPGIGSSAIGRLLDDSLVRPHPRPLPRLDLDAARTVEGAQLIDNDGVCVANYRVADSNVGDRLTWTLDDECVAQQVAVLLPEVSAYSTGALDYLFRGIITLEKRDKSRVAVAGGAEFATGTLQLFWDDGRGVRQPHGEPIAIERANTGQILGPVSKPPKAAYALAALYRGVDNEGQPLVAAGYLRLRKAARKPAPNSQKAGQKAGQKAAESKSK